MPVTAKSNLLLALRSGGAKAVVLPLNAVLSLLTMRLIIENYGTQSYAEYGLLLSMGALLPFADLGISAAVVNASASSNSPRTDVELRRIITTALRFLLLVGIVLIVVDLIVLHLDGWPLLMGKGLNPETGPGAASLCLAIFAVSLPFGVGQRLLVGLGKNHYQIFLQTVQYPLILLFVYVLVMSGAEAGQLLAALSYLAVGIIAAATFFLAGALSSPMLWEAVGDIFRIRKVRNAKIFHVAWPMLVQMMAIPIITQSARLILSQVSTVEELAQYNLSSQLYMPIWQVTGAAGVALWPYFAKARTTGIPASPFPVAWLFMLAIAVIASVATLCVPWASGVISGGAISLDLPLCVAFASFVTLNAFLYPLGMFMTDGPGLRFQAICIAVFLPISVTLSLWLATWVGAAGPVVACTIGMLVSQVIPNAIFVRSALRKARAHSSGRQSLADESQDAVQA
jgi:O-antigen/teichoic acid export membrane protein